MSLTTYFNNLDYQQHFLEFEATPPTLDSPQQQQNQHLLAYEPDETSFFLPPFPNSTLDVEHASLLYPSDIIYPPLFHCNSAFDPNNISLSSDDFLLPIPHQEDYYNLLPFPKRQKCFFYDNNHEQDYSSELELVQSNFFDGFVCNSLQLQPEEPPLALPEAELYYAMPEFNVPQLPQCGNFVANDDGGDNKKSNENQKTISAQSLAARERRRKITEKTHELGKMVPGGPKMNTAEMLHAAGKYIKYLQAQVQMLQLMDTLQEEEATPSIDEDLQTLFVSPFVQEKMYLEEKCFVPKDFITTLTNLDDLQSSPSILKDLKQLIGTDTKNKPKQE